MTVSPEGAPGALWNKTARPIAGSGYFASTGFPGSFSMLPPVDRSLSARSMSFSARSRENPPMMAEETISSSVCYVEKGVVSAWSRMGPATPRTCWTK